MSKYYARSQEDIDFDNTIRDSIQKSKSKSHMALFLQGQEELNILRALIDNQEQMRGDLDALHILIDKAPELHEQYGACITEDEAYNMVMDELDAIRMRIDDLLLYILESEDSELDEEFERMHGDAESLVRISAKKARDYNGLLKSNICKEDSRDREVILWDYILSCLNYCRNEYESISR